MFSELNGNVSKTFLEHIFVSWPVTRFIITRKSITSIGEEDPNCTVVIVIYIVKVFSVNGS